MFGRKFLLLRKKIISLKDSVLDDDKSEFPSMKNECVTSLDSGFVSSRKRLKSNLKISLKHTTELCSLENENGAHMSTRGDSQDLSLLFGLESQQKSILFEREADEETHTENFTLSKFKEILNQNNRNINKLIDEIKFKEEGDLRKFLNRKLFQVYYNERFFIYSNVSTRYHRIKYINITNKVCNSNTSFISQYKSLSWKIQREIELTLFPVDFISLQLLKSRMNEKEIQSQIEKIQHELEYKNSLREEFQQRKNVKLLPLNNVGLTYCNEHRGVT